jgi:hypothetical protein
MRKLAEKIAIALNLHRMPYWMAIALLITALMCFAAVYLQIDYLLGTAADGGCAGCAP